MSDNSDFLEYLEMQDGLDLIAKSELLDVVRKNGGRISDRQLTSYVSSGLVPKSARIGSRSGVYPAIVADLVCWIDRCRRRGLSVEAISELAHVWRFLTRGVKRKEIDLGEFEYIARQFVTLQEGAYAVPTVVIDCLPCPVHESDQLAEIAFIMKDHSRFDPSNNTALTLSFRLGEYEPATDTVISIARTCMTIPMADAVNDDANAIVLGIPNGVPWPSDENDGGRHTADEVDLI
jgi:DNA-binding transcriptional MerR regulator